MSTTYGQGTYAGADTPVSTEMNLREDKSKRTATTVTLLWDAQQNVSGFQFYKNGKFVARGTNPSQTTTKISAKVGDAIEVVATAQSDKLAIS